MPGDPPREVALFDSIIRVEGAPRWPRPLGASAALHLLAVILLFWLRFSYVPPRVPSARERFIVLSPVARAAVNGPRSIAPGRRSFRPVEAERAAIPSAPLIAAPPAPSTLRLPDLPRLAPPTVLPAVVAGVFEEVKPAGQVIARQTPPKASGFEGAVSSSTPPVRRKPAAMGLFDSASAAKSPTARPLPGAAPSGFSEASVLPAAVAAPRAAVAGTAFGDASAGRTAPARRASPVSPYTPIEILSKPRPSYTTEARARGIEGEVLIEVQFCASGEAKLTRLVHGLGYGLDEAAMAAARGIRFRPAMRDGLAVDSSAVVRIVFQLAN